MAVVRHKHFQRYTEIAGVLVDEGLDVLLEQLGLTRFVSIRKRVAPTARAEPGSPFPLRIRRTLERLGPTFVKLGQILSTRPDIVPPEYVEELRRLQDTVETIPYEQVVAQIRLGLGADVDELFADFDPVPLAAASIGQVHAARLLDGSDVVVKVQRPGMERAIDVDLDILKTQARFAERHTLWGERYHLVANAEEISRILHLELDYMAEGRNAERFAERFAENPDVVIPRVYWEYTSRTVLTMERLRGIKLDEFDRLRAAGYDLREIAQKGVHVYLEMVFVDGFFHADPHPGNLFVLPGTRIGISDFGRVGRIGERMRDEFGDLLLALIQQDESEAVDVLLDLGVASADVDIRSLQRSVGRMLSQYYDATLEEVRLADVVQQLLRIVWRHHLIVPPDFTLLLTTITALEGVARQLDPQFDFVRSVRPFVTELARVRYRPKALAMSALRVLRRLEHLAVELPDSTERVLRRFADGTFSIELKPEAFTPVVDQLRELVNRLAFALVIASFVVGFSFILRQATLSKWFIYLVEASLIGAAGCGVWFFSDIFFTMWRNRRWRRR